jgi:hypothetical protein
MQQAAIQSGVKESVEGTQVENYSSPNPFNIAGGPRPEGGQRD